MCTAKLCSHMLVCLDGFVSGRSLLTWTDNLPTCWKFTQQNVLPPPTLRSGQDEKPLASDIKIIVMTLLHKRQNNKKQQQTETGHLVVFVHLGNHPKVPPPTTNSIPIKTHLEFIMNSSKHIHNSSATHPQLIQVTLEFQLHRCSHFTKVKLCDHFTIGQFQGPARSNASLASSENQKFWLGKPWQLGIFWCQFCILHDIVHDILIYFDTWCL